MNWKGLMTNNCPQCNRDLVRGMVVTQGGRIDDMIAGDMSGKMLHHTCGFMITEQRYKEIVSVMVEDELLSNAEILV